LLVGHSCLLVLALIDCLLNCLTVHSLLHVLLLPLPSFDSTN
jgi:hypothetical protein